MPRTRRRQPSIDLSILDFSLALVDDKIAELQRQRAEVVAAREAALAEQNARAVRTTRPTATTKPAA